MITRKAVLVYASSLMEAVRCHLGAAGAPPALATPAQAVSLRQVLEGKLTDPRKPRGIRHSLASLVSVLVGGGCVRVCQHPGNRGGGGGPGPGGAGRARGPPQPADR
jgi:hypothetical protein